MRTEWPLNYPVIRNVLEKRILWHLSTVDYDFLFTQHCNRQPRARRGVFYWLFFIAAWCREIVALQTFADGGSRIWYGITLYDLTCKVDMSVARNQKIKYKVTWNAKDNSGQLAQSECGPTTGSCESWGGGYSGSTAVQAWQPCPLWESSPSHPMDITVD